MGNEEKSTISVTITVNGKKTDGKVPDLSGVWAGFDKAMEALDETMKAVDKIVKEATDEK